MFRTPLDSVNAWFLPVALADLTHLREFLVAFAKLMSSEHHEESRSLDNVPLWVKPYDRNQDMVLVDLPSWYPLCNRAGFSVIHSLVARHLF
jgi:hypothetical protein